MQPQSAVYIDIVYAWGIHCAPFRMVSYDAVCVVSYIISNLIGAAVRSLGYSWSDRYQGSKDSYDSAKEWLYNTSMKGRWTYRLISDVARWSRRKHGELAQYLTQLLTGHYCFRAYLHRLLLQDNTSCSISRTVQCRRGACVLPPYTRRWQTGNLTGTSSPPVIPETITEKMLASETIWEALVFYAAIVILELWRAGKPPSGLDLSDA